jgi:hypothetical protein
MFYSINTSYDNAPVVSSLPRYERAKLNRAYAFRHYYVLAHVAGSSFRTYYVTVILMSSE